MIELMDIGFFRKFDVDSRVADSLFDLIVDD